MGIKGRRKRSLSKPASGRDTQFAEADLEELHQAGQLPEGLVPSPKMKNSEKHDMQDMEYLDQAREENRNRKGPTKARRRETEELALEANAATDEAFSPQPAIAPANLTRSGPKFAHPLLGLDARLIDALAMEGFLHMTPIQTRAIPLCLQSYDILGQAKTGSGKTLAFTVPILNAALMQTAPHCIALVLSPTKELCAQINQIVQRISKHLAAPKQKTHVSCELITGGTKIAEERRRLIDCQIVVGTPGRVLDHIQHTPSWKIRTTLQFLVMDEADRLLADGFQRDLDAIMMALPSHRQTFLFSATNSKSVRELARLSLGGNPIFVSTSGDAPRALNDGATAPPYSDFGVESDPSAVSGESIPSTLAQFCQVVPTHERLRALFLFIKRVSKTSKAMVFCSTVASAQFHCMMMGAAGFHEDVLMLHGKMKHRQRLATFDAFRSWSCGVLFCTDVAARGLDIPRVDWILQYDPPTDPTEYIHRIGRTARAGAVGNALMFVSPQEIPFVKYLAKYNIQLKVLPSEPVPEIQKSLQHILELDAVVARHAEQAFRACIAAYQSHVLSSIFDATKVNLEDLAISFALATVPNVSIPKSSKEEKSRDYVKGKLKSLTKRSNQARAEYERLKTRQQWNGDGVFVGMKRPNNTV